MKKDLVSIIVPVYNTELYIKECLDRLVNQTYKNIEVILVDDGSTDNSPKICDEYSEKDSRFKVFHRKNHGPASSRNFGFTKTTGKYIMFCDSDDTYDLDMVKAMVSTIKKYKTDVVRCTFNSVEQYEDISDISDKKYNTHDIDILSRFITSYKHLIGFTTVYIIDRDHMVKLHDKITYMEDLYFVIKLLLNSNSISFVDKKLYTYRYNPTSITKTSTKAISNIESGLFCFSEIEKLLKEKELFTDELKIRMNSMLCLLLYTKLCRIDNKIFKEHKNEILNILNREDFISTYANSNKNEMSFVLRIVRWLIIHKHFNMMFRVIWFKEGIKKFIK